MEYLLANISHVDFASSKLPNKLEMEGMEVFRIHVRIHVVVTKEGDIFFTCSLDRNSDCTSTIMPDHATLKKTVHNLRPR